MSGPLTVKKVVEARCGTDMQCQEAAASDQSLTKDIYSAIQGDGAKVCVTALQCAKIFDGRLPKPKTPSFPTLSALLPVKHKPDGPSLSALSALNAPAGTTLKNLGIQNPALDPTFVSLPVEKQISLMKEYAQKVFGITVDPANPLKGTTQNIHRPGVLFGMNFFSPNYQSEFIEEGDGVNHIDFEFMSTHHFNWTRTLAKITGFSKVEGGLRVAARIGSDGNGYAKVDYSSYIINLGLRVHPAGLQINFDENNNLMFSVFGGLIIPMGGDLYTGGKLTNPGGKWVEGEVGGAIGFNFAKNGYVDLLAGARFFKKESEEGKMPDTYYHDYNNELVTPFIMLRLGATFR